MWGRRSSRTAVIGTAFVAFIVCCVLPVAYMLVHGAAWQTSGATRRCCSMRGSEACCPTRPLLGIGTALLATAIGAPLGLALARVPLRRNRCGGLRSRRRCSSLPTSWLWPGSTWKQPRSGADAHRRRPGSEWTYSLPGAIVVLGLVFYPLSMLATEVALRRVDGASRKRRWWSRLPGRVVRRITLPLAAPRSRLRRS